MKSFVMRVLLVSAMSFLSRAAAFVIKPNKCSSGTLLLKSHGSTAFGEGESRRLKEEDNDRAIRSPKSRGLTIPVLTAIPGALPLVVGAETVLKRPTPGQWFSLQESMTLHHNYLLDRDESQTTTPVDASPLVAIMDDYTATGGEGVTGRYATIAAVLGVSSSRYKDQSYEQIMADCSPALDPLSSRVRLVGIGRALLTDFFYTMPTEVAEDHDDGCSVDDGGNTGPLDARVDLDDDDDEEDDDEYYESQPVIMAECKILIDASRTTSLSTYNQIGHKGVKGSPNKAPVYALNEMSNLANRVIHLHNARRQLVNTITSKKARLEQGNIYHDVDGIGSLDLQHETKRLMDDYGISYYSRFSSLDELTGVAQDILQDFYSPSKRDTEEYRLELLSFVAFRSLKGYCTPQDMAWALHCTNSLERLNKALDLMNDHIWSLKQLSKEWDDLDFDQRQQQPLQEGPVASAHQANNSQWYRG